ncbi:uncharacterized protein A1O9_12358 [Exophiala aquamarina CBS 119918]|uniref:Uncharacterized protein n=1 Tax=Exophiala aquamarina CBS 119918 TaxID=1182545 RepID=A0A072NXH1_9EURO|nr:uncharacterized protein A1O9_12358 [Exophiala aquamarina CBS 119918]KEF51723.1 hypothetical protein A1O9_12358 [Exophiala aquamarina CBS 119918]
MGNKFHNGFWTNWEDGKIGGATLTLPAYAGLILVSFLTLFVQYSGSCFWRVVSFILHQTRSVAASKDGLFHQQQAILRNSVTATNAFWTIASSASAWTSKGKGKGKENRKGVGEAKPQAPLRTSLPLLLVSAIHISLFTVAGLFSSRVTTTSASGQALMTGDICGFPDEVENLRGVEPENLDEEGLLTFNTQVLLGRLTLSRSAAYVRSCYNNNDNGASGGCNVYVQPYLHGVNASSVNDTSCPFVNEETCATSSAVRYDSGAIHSNEDLGINSPESDAMTIRRITSCAPVSAKRYATDWIEDLPEALGDGRTNTTIKFYEMGQPTSGDNDGCDATFKNSTTNLTTFCVSEFMKTYVQEPYTIRVQTSYYDNETASDFIPIPDLQVANADVTLIAIFNKARYSEMVDDELFSAHNESSSWGPGFFTATDDLSVLGCTEQYQFCNIRNTQCTPVTGLYGIKHALNSEDGDLDLSPKQRAIFELLWMPARSMSLQWSFKVLGTELLLAKDWLWATVSVGSSALPPNHWQLEARNLHNVSLAVLQRRVSEFASPNEFEIRPGLNSLAQVRVPSDPALRDLCTALKLRSSEHISVSVLGMGIILGVGSLLILLDFVLIQQLFWMNILWWRNRSPRRQKRKEDWQTTGTLQLQKSAFEARGIGPWDDDENETPVLVDRDKKFARLNDLNEDCKLGENTGDDVGYGRGTYAPVPNQTMESRSMDV